MKLRGRWTFGIGLLLLAGLAAGVCYRTALLAKYYEVRLARCADTDRANWVDRLAELDQAALPALENLLKSTDAGPAAQALFDRLAELWQDDSRRLRLLQTVAAGYPGYSPVGQAQVLKATSGWSAARAVPPEAVDAVVRMLALAGHATDSTVRCRSILLARSLLGTGGAETLTACRERIREALTDADPAVRAAAANGASAVELNLLADVAPLLDDPAPEVRQAALATLGPPEASAAVTTDDLLRSLHDSDADVRRLCEAALRSRSLSDRDILMARLITAPQPSVRLQVLEKLRRAPDLEPGIWLRRLSRDPSPAVRAAAVRAATEDSRVDLAERLAQMAHSDPSDTVRQLAEHYLSSQQKATNPRFLR